MSIFFRVHDGPDDGGTLYDRSFTPSDDFDPGPQDLILTSSRAQFTQILAAKPTHVVIRVHEDPDNRDIEEGDLYDEHFRPAPDSILGRGNPVLFTVTPEDFHVVLDAKK